MKWKKTTENIYRFLGSTIVGGAHSFERSDDTTRLWHLYFGHLGEYDFS